MRYFRIIVVPAAAAAAAAAASFALTILACFTGMRSNRTESPHRAVGCCVVVFCLSENE